MLLASAFSHQAFGAIRPPSLALARQQAACPPCASFSVIPPRVPPPSAKAAPELGEPPPFEGMGGTTAGFIDTLPITPMWRERLRKLARPAAVALVPRLSTANGLGFVNKAVAKGGGNRKTLVDFVAKEKASHPDKLLLVRVGEFYECFGVDAVMLVEHAGLNPMGGKCRAGCPLQNVQPTLNDLTAAGLTVAVYEEIAPPPGGKGPYSKLKQRALAQVVSPGSPTYMYEACLKRQEIARTRLCGP
jgi:hypothetical protein